MSALLREQAIGRFLAGQSVADVATFYGVNKLTVERVLRVALQQLVTMTAKHAPEEKAV